MSDSQSARVPLSARVLIMSAIDVYDRDPRLALHARTSALRGFAGGLDWMAGQDRRQPCGSGHRLGLVKYGLCLLLGAAVFAAVIPQLGIALALIASLLAFYALESRWVFVFPAAAHGDPQPFRTSWNLVQKHGGTVAAMRIVLPLAAFMLVGGWLGRGFLRAWCIGCLAVLLWYRALTNGAEA